MKKGSYGTAAQKNHFHYREYLVLRNHSPEQISLVLRASLLTCSTSIQLELDKCFYKNTDSIKNKWAASL